jgi:hypothetical protein
LRWTKNPIGGGYSPKLGCKVLFEDENHGGSLYGGGGGYGNTNAHKKITFLCGYLGRTMFSPGIILKKGINLGLVGVHLQRK